MSGIFFVLSPLLLCLSMCNCQIVSLLISLSVWRYMPGAGNDRKTEVQCTRHIGNDRKHNGTLNWLIIVFSFTYNNNQSFVLHGDPTW